MTAAAKQLRIEAAEQSDPVITAALERDAERRESSVPSWRNVRWDRLGFASLLYACALVPPGWVLHRGLQALAVPCSRRRALAAQLLGHAGKYIPGKAMVVFLRISAILPPPGQPIAATVGVDSSGIDGGGIDGGGIDDIAGHAGAAPATREGHALSLDPARPIGRVASCVFFETLLMMGVGGAVAGVLLWGAPLPDWVRWLAAAMAIGSLVPICPPVLRRLLIFIAARRKLVSRRGDTFSPGAVTWSLLAQCWLLSLVSWALIGLSFAMLIAAIPSLDPLPRAADLTAVATAAISLGMVLGFASLLPGGAGVREYVTLLVLTPLIGQTHALLAVIAARLMFILVETILAGLSAAYLRHLRYLQPIYPG